MPGDDVGCLRRDLPIGGELSPGDLDQAGDGLPDDVPLDAFAVDSPLGSASARRPAKLDTGSKSGTSTYRRTWRIR